MDFEILFTNGEDIYIVKKDDFFYTIDIAEDTEPLKSKYVEAFLKFGGFEFVEDTVCDVILEKIRLVLLKYKGKPISYNCQ